VYLAMSGAERRMNAVDAALREPSREGSLLRKLEKRQRAGMDRFSFFIYRFNGPVMQQMFRQRAIHGSWEQGVNLDAGGRPVDTPQGAVAPEAVQAGLCDQRPASSGSAVRAEHKYRWRRRARIHRGNTPLDKI